MQTYIPSSFQFFKKSNKIGYMTAVLNCQIIACTLRKFNNLIIKSDIVHCFFPYLITRYVNTYLLAVKLVIPRVDSVLSSLNIYCDKWILPAINIFCKQ